MRYICLHHMPYPLTYLLSKGFYVSDFGPFSYSCWHQIDGSLGKSNVWYVPHYNDHIDVDHQNWLIVAMWKLVSHDQRCSSQQVMFLSEGISRARQELWSGTTNTEQIHKKYKQTHVDDVDKNPFA